MKRKINYPLLALAMLLTGLYSCKKEVSSITQSSTTTSSTASATTLAATANQAIAIGTLATTTTTATTATAKDSLYLLGCFPPKGRKDTIAFSALPTAVTTYLTTNYSGYTFLKAFKTTDSLKVLNGYVVVIKYNGKPVGLKFDATGTFVKVLMQAEGPDLAGGRPGFFHPGGQFAERDGMHRDTIALSAIPTAVKSFFTTTYPTDTLLHAGINLRDTSYILISKNNGLFATVISSAGKLLKRVQIDVRPVHTTVLQSALLSSISTYLTATYPGYVFDKAYAETVGTTLKEYEVFITVNTTNYVVKFDASGTFVSSIAIR